MIKVSKCDDNTSRVEFEMEGTRIDIMRDFMVITNELNKKLLFNKELMHAMVDCAIDQNITTKKELSFRIMENLFKNEE